MAEAKVAKSDKPKATRKPAVRRKLFFVYPQGEPKSEQARITYNADEVLDLPAGFEFVRIPADRQRLSPKDSKSA